MKKKHTDFDIKGVKLSLGNAAAGYKKYLTSF